MCVFVVPKLNSLLVLFRWLLKNCFHLQVGIYGYTAYSASKFGLRGMAESLQQEVITDNIHISLIFPPDTETPGLAEGLGFYPV